MQEQKSINANWNLLYKLGSIAAIGAVLGERSAGLVQALGIAREGS